MKKYFAIALAAGLLLATVSCRKDDGEDYGEMMPNLVRKVRYELFTKSDFSKSPETIHFSLVMRAAGHEVFDSALAAMRISDIPDSLHRLVFEKLVPDGIQDTLAVGFDYAIDGVGAASFQQPFPGCDTLKILSFSFD